MVCKNRIKQCCIVLLLSNLILGCSNGTPRRAQGSALAEVHDTVIFGVRTEVELFREVQQALHTPASQAIVHVWRPDPGLPSYSRADSLITGIRFQRVPDPLARECFGRFIDRFRNEGNYIFLTNMDFQEAWKPLFDVTIIPAKDQFSVVAQVGTQAGNYDISNEEIIARLRSWNERDPFDLAVVDDDRVEGYFISTPRNPLGLAREILDFCPDVIQQGYEDTTVMVKDLQEHRFFWMWWD